jgi:hypothetical protein
MKSLRLAAGLAALLFVFPWLAVTLVANVALAPAAGPGTASSQGGGAVIGPSIVVQPSAVQGPSSLELVVMATIMATTVAVIAWRLGKRRRRKDDYFWVVERPKTNPFLGVALLGVLAASFYGLITLAEHAPAFVTYGQSVGLPPILPYIALAAVVAGSAVAVAVSISVMRSSRLTTGKAASVGEMDRTELSQVLTKAANELDLGSDYRGAIMSCYRAICRLLDMGETTDSSKLTAREFESHVAARLGIGRSYLHEATLLFERARYSTTALREDDARRSQMCLRKLSEQVLSPNPREEGR